MSQENIELLRRAIQAFISQDSEGWVDCFHPDIALMLPRNVIEGGSYRGIEGAERAFADAYDTWEAFRIDVDDFRTIDDYAVGLGRATNVSKGEAPTIAFESAYVARVREHKIVYLRSSQSHSEALEAVGLSE